MIGMNGTAYGGGDSLGGVGSYRLTPNNVRVFELPRTGESATSLDIVTKGVIAIANGSDFTSGIGGDEVAEAAGDQAFIALHAAGVDALRPVDPADLYGSE